MSMLDSGKIWRPKSEMSDTMTEIKNMLDGINSRSYYTKEDASIPD